LTENRWMRTTGFAAVACFMVAAAVINYWPILNNTFIADDHFFINAFRVTPLSGIELLFTKQSPLFVRPMTMFVFWVHSRMFGLNPWPAHLINVFLHGGIAFMLFLFIERLGARKLTAFVAAILFLLSPIAPEVVTWLSGRADELSLFFMLLAMLLYSFYLTKRSWAAFSGAMLAAAVSLLSKEQGYILIILLPSMDFLFGGIFLRSEIDPKEGLKAKTGQMLKDAWSQLTDRGFIFRHCILLSLICGNIILHLAILGKMGGYEGVPLIDVPTVDGSRATFITLISPLNSDEFSWETIHALGYYSAMLVLTGIALVFSRWRKTNAKARRLLIMMVIFFIASVLPANSAIFSTGIHSTLKESRLLYSATLCLLSIIVIALLEFGWQRLAWKITALTALLLLVPVYIVGLNFNNQPWQRAAAVNYSIPKQTVELVPNPPRDARLYFSLPLLYKDNFIMGYGLGYGFEDSIKAAYDRDDLVVIRVKKYESEPVPDSHGYIFDYDLDSGLLVLTRVPDL